MERIDYSQMAVPLTPPGLTPGRLNTDMYGTTAPAPFGKAASESPTSAPLQDLKLFVGGISWETTETHLRAHFSRYGEIVDCVLMTNKWNGAPRGFAFVTYADPLSVTRVLAENHEIDGRVIEVKRAIPKDDNKDRVAPSATRLDRRKIFVGGLAGTVMETDLRTYFSQFGPILDASVMIDRTTNRSRGFGFVTFANLESVDAVLRNIHKVHEKIVEVKPAQPRMDRDGRPQDTLLPFSMPADVYASALPPRAVGLSHPDALYRAHGPGPSPPTAHRSLYPPPAGAAEYRMLPPRYGEMPMPADPYGVRSGPPSGYGSWYMSPGFPHADAGFDAGGSVGDGYPRLEYDGITAGIAGPSMAGPYRAASGRSGMYPMGGPPPDYGGVRPGPSAMSQGGAKLGSRYDPRIDAPYYGGGRPPFYMEHARTASEPADAVFLGLAGTPSPSPTSASSSGQQEIMVSLAAMRLGSEPEKPTH